MHLRRKRLIVLGVAGALMACIAVLAGSAALVPTAFPAVAPLLARQLYDKPEQWWDFYVAAYNEEYATGNPPQPRADFQRTLAQLCTADAQVDWPQWVVMRATEGEITASTLTLTMQESAYVRGIVHLTLQHGPTHCYEVEFVRGAASYQIQTLRPCTAEDSE